MDNNKTPSPSPLRYILGCLCVGIAWGFTTPLIRQAALKRQQQQQQQQQPQEQQQKHTDNDINTSWIYRQLVGVWMSVADMLRRPAYTIPLLVNLSGSALFFLIVGQAELSLTVPITNSLAFLFTVLGEWIAEGKSISKDTWMGMALVLAGIAVCVHAKAGDV